MPVVANDSTTYGAKCASNRRTSLSVGKPTATAGQSQPENPKNYHNKQKMFHDNLLFLFVRRFWMCIYSNSQAV
jgi:hypothetical protein